MQYQRNGGHPIAIASVVVAAVSIAIGITILTTIETYAGIYVTGNQDWGAVACLAMLALGAWAVVGMIFRS